MIASVLVQVYDVVFVCMCVRVCVCVCIYMYVYICVNTRGKTSISRVGSAVMIASVRV